MVPIMSSYSQVCELLCLISDATDDGVGQEVLEEAETWVDAGVRCVDTEQKSASVTVQLIRMNSLATWSCGDLTERWSFIQSLTS